MRNARLYWLVLLIVGQSCADSTIPDENDERSTVEQIAEKSGLTAYLREHPQDEQGAHIVGEVRFIASHSTPRPWHSRPKLSKFKIAIMLGDPLTTYVDVFRDTPNVAEEKTQVGDGHMRVDVYDIREGLEAPQARLTFREFSEGAYFIENAPSGPAKVWFQTPIDGNRVTQIPIDVSLQPEPGKLTRLDLEVDLLDVIHYW